MADYKLVPVEPTPGMLYAMWQHREAMRGQSENKIARASYAELLAAAPQAPSGQQAEPTDEQLIAAARTAKAKHWSLRDEDCVLIGRAVLALAGQQSERPAPAGQAVVIRALTMARHALVNLRINKSAESLALANALDEALAGQQSERPAPAGQAVGEVQIRAAAQAISLDKAFVSAFRQGAQFALAASQAERVGGGE